MTWRELPWDRQPEAASAIASPFLRDIALVADGGEPLPRAGNPLIASSPEGFALLGTRRTGPSGRGWTGSSGTYVSAKTNGASPDVLCEFPANSDVTCQLVIDGISVASGSNAGFWRGGSTFVGPTFVVQNGTSRRPWARVNGVDILQPASGYQWQTGKTLNLIWRFKNAAYTDFWYDGALRHSATHSTSLPTMTTTAGIYALLRQDSNYTGGTLVAARFWRRFLSTRETEQLAKSPWALYEPRRIWVPVSAGGGAAALPLFVHHYRQQGIM